MKSSRPVLIIFSVLAGLQVLSAGAALGDLIGHVYFGLFGLAVASVQVGMTFYVQNQTVPIGQVAAYVTGGDNPSVIAGPAAAATDGTEVTVHPVEPDPEPEHD